MMEIIYSFDIWTWVIITVITIATIFRVVQLKWFSRDNNENSTITTRSVDRNSISSGNSIQKQNSYETGMVVYFANNPHRLKDKEYQFNYKRVNGLWRAYILRMPSLNGRDTSGLITHRLFEGSQSYVCWDSPVTSLRDIQAISKVWADNIQEYIATGKRFG